MSRVLFLAARDDLYGASRALLAHVRRLGPLGIEPIVVTPEPGPLHAALVAAGVEVETASGVASSRSLRSRILAPLRLRSVVALAGRRGVRLVVASTLSAAPTARHVARAMGVPSVVHLRSTYVGRGKATAIARYGAAEAGGVIAVSRAVLDEYEGLAPSSRASTLRAPQLRRVVLDGIEPTKPLPPAEARARLGLPADARIAGIVGAIRPLKGTHFAAQIAERAGLLLGVLGEGDGPELDAVTASPAVRLLGFRSDAASLLSAFDVVLHPARQEGFGLAPLEAMAAGVPVLVSDVEGLREAAGEAAIRLDPTRLEDWIEAVGRVLDDGPLRTSLIERGRAHAARHTADASAEQVAAFYREIIEDRGT